MVRVFPSSQRELIGEWYATRLPGQLLWCFPTGRTLVPISGVFLLLRMILAYWYRWIRKETRGERGGRQESEWISGDCFPVKYSLFGECFAEG